MSACRRLIRTGLPLALLSLGGLAGGADQSHAGPLAAGPTETVSVEEARAGLRRALAGGDTAMAAELAQALVRSFPKDFAAQAALTEVRIRQGQAREARASARRAQALARTEAQVFEASLLRARASGLSGGAIDGVMAGYWARRAIQEAPLDGYKALARGEAQRLRAAAPLELQFSIAAMPSSNVNNGSREHEITLPGWGGLTWALSPQSRALSGWIGEATLIGRYRLSEAAHRARALNFALHHRAVTLSSEAKEAIGAWQAAQRAAGNSVPEMPRYDYSVIELGLGERRAAAGGIWSFSGAINHTHFGGATLHDAVKLETGFEQAWRKGQVSLSISAEKQWGQAAADAEILGLDLGLLQKTGSGNHLRLSGHLRHAESANLDQRHEAMGLRFGWSKAEAVAGLRVEASLGAEWRRYDPSLLSASGRRDLRLDGAFSLGMERLEYMGFSPALHMTLGRVKSNVSLYEGSSSGVSLRLRSVF